MCTVLYSLYSSGSIPQRNSDKSHPTDGATCQRKLSIDSIVYFNRTRTVTVIVDYIAEEDVDGKRNDLENTRLPIQ